MAVPMEKPVTLEFSNENTYEQTCAKNQILHIP